MQFDYISHHQRKFLFGSFKHYCYVHRTPTVHLWKPQWNVLFQSDPGCGQVGYTQRLLQIKQKMTSHQSSFSELQRVILGHSRDAACDGLLNKMMPDVELGLIQMPPLSSTVTLHPRDLKLSSRKTFGVWYIWIPPCFLESCTSQGLEAKPLGIRVGMWTQPWPPGFNMSHSCSK